MTRTIGVSVRISAFATRIGTAGLVAISSSCVSGPLNNLTVKWLIMKIAIIPSKVKSILRRLFFCSFIVALEAHRRRGGWGLWERGSQFHIVPWLRLHRQFPVPNLPSPSCRLTKRRDSRPRPLTVYDARPTHAKDPRRPGLVGIIGPY